MSDFLIVARDQTATVRLSETAGITDTFTEQERANVLSDWRIVRRANFDALNPWGYA